MKVFASASSSPLKEIIMYEVRMFRSFEQLLMVETQFERREERAATCRVNRNVYMRENKNGKLNSVQ